MEGGTKSKGVLIKSFDWVYIIMCFLLRVYSLGSLKRGEKDILVATDVAGRGIDIRYRRELHTWFHKPYNQKWFIGMCHVSSTMTWQRLLRTIHIALAALGVLEKLEWLLLSLLMMTQQLSMTLNRSAATFSNIISL